MTTQNAILGILLWVLVACNAPAGPPPNLRGEWADRNPIRQILPPTPNCPFLISGVQVFFFFETTQPDGSITGTMLATATGAPVVGIGFSAKVSPDGKVAGAFSSGWKLEASVVGDTMTGTVTVSLDTCSGKPKGILTFKALKKVN